MVIDINFVLEGINQYKNNRNNVNDTDNTKKSRSYPAKNTFLFIHYCCTSLERVARNCNIPIATTIIKNSTAFAAKLNSLVGNFNVAVHIRTVKCKVFISLCTGNRCSTAVYA